MEPMAPFTKADEMMAARLQQAMAQARESFDDGDVDDEEYQGLLQQIQDRLAPLQERQQQAEEQSRAQQEQEVARQHAQMQAMETEAAMHRAKAFPSRLVKVQHDFDPLRVETFYEKAPNQWEQVKWSPSVVGDESSSGEAEEEGGGYE